MVMKPEGQRRVLSFISANGQYVARGLALASSTIFQESVKWVKKPVAKNDSRGGWAFEKVIGAVAVVEDH